MKKEKWWDVLKSTKPKRKPGEFDYMHELEPHLRGPGQNRWGGQQNVRLKTFKGKFGIIAARPVAPIPETIFADERDDVCVV